VQATLRLTNIAYQPSVHRFGKKRKRADHAGYGVKAGRLEELDCYLNVWNLSFGQDFRYLSGLSI